MIAGRGLIPVAVTLTAVGTVSALEARAQVLLFDKCRVVLQSSWIVTRRDSAAQGDSTILLFPAPDQQAGINMSRGFREIARNETRILLLNPWPDGRTQLRSITDTAPACIADAIVPRGISSDSARKIVSSLTRVPPAPNRATAR
jgi:hypothetical protein